MNTQIPLNLWMAASKPQGLFVLRVKASSEADRELFGENALRRMAWTDGNVPFIPVLASLSRQFSYRSTWIPLSNM